jgi:hypothetical protein|tara:strand:+ start:129 stop:560 length:432 start_codon:yes stop_codon:yes gene_type:complete
MKFFSCYDEYLNQESCDFLIKTYKENSDKTFKYYDTEPLELSSNELTDKIQFDFNIKSKLSNFQIVKRMKGSYMANHYDEGDDIAFIIYLNDDYIGGHTIFNDETSIVPKKGRILLFSNGKILHKVSKITQGTRYILAGWYVK